MFTLQAATGTQPAASGATAPMRSGLLRLLVGASAVAAATTIVAPVLANPAVAGPPPAPLPVVARGTVVDTATGAPVAGARVSYAEVGARNARWTFTNRLGQYRIDGLRGEEYAIHIRGPRNYEVGFVGCAVHRVLPIIRWTYPVVPTWGAACSHSPRAMGRIGLDRRF